jgi:AraC-like DNA-binding protein
MINPLSVILILPQYKSRRLSNPLLHLSVWFSFQAAKKLLSGSEMTTEEIAGQTGFCSSSYFCKLFKRYEDITPTQFRNI